MKKKCKSLSVVYVKQKIKKRGEKENSYSRHFSEFNTVLFLKTEFDSLPSASRIHTE